MHREPINVIKIQKKNMNLDTKHRSLTKAELHMMNLLWDKGNATVNDLMEMLPEPHPAYTTVLTVMRVLVKKGIVEAKPNGKQHVYSPIMTREEYTTGFMEETRNTLFKDSWSSLVSFFAKYERLTTEDIQELIAILKKSMQKEENPSEKETENNY